MADLTYGPKTYRKSGGDNFVVANGGTVTLESGGEIVVESGGAIEAPEVANANIQGGIPVLHRIDIADGAGDTDVVLDHKTRVIDAWAVKTAADGGAGDTVTVKNGATAITDAMSLNAVDKSVVRAGTIDDAQHEIAAGGTLKITAANVTNNACVVYVLGVRVS
jgi:hypothetical protein